MIDVIGDENVMVRLCLCVVVGLFIVGSLGLLLVWLSVCWVFVVFILFLGCVWSFGSNCIFMCCFGDIVI